MNNQQDKFSQNVKQQLENSLDTIDSATLSRLTQARYHALSSTKEKPSHIWHWVGTMAAVALFVVIVMPRTQTQDASLITPPDWMLVSKTDDIELYQNLEFYEWLETENSNS